MKKTLSLLFAINLLLVLSSSLYAQQRAEDAVNFPNTAFNFGKIEQGNPVYHIFEFENKLNKPVVVENVQTSCGCTTPEWDKAPIAPGKKSSIKVGYNAASMGSFNKSIQVFVKDANVPYVLKISGEVTSGDTKDKNTEDTKSKSVASKK